jgi:ATP-dependent Clp protease ATP-binding subunit ClpC
MFNKFTERAQKVLIYAEEEAAKLKHGYVGTEHILLGILKQEDGVCKKI